MAAVLSLLACKKETPMTDSIEAPRAKKVEKKLTIHNDTRIDNYYWLNDREDQEVIDYLNKENDYLKEKTKHTEEFQNTLFEELKARIILREKFMDIRFGKRPLEREITIGTV